MRRDRSAEATILAGINDAEQQVPARHLRRGNRQGQGAMHTQEAIEP